MKVLLSALLVFWFASGAMTPAAAQLAPGYSGYSSAPVAGSQKDYWYLIRHMGSCLSKSKKEEALTFLANPPGSTAEDAAFDALFNQRKRNPCMQNFVQVSMQRSHLRGSLAEALYRRAKEEVSPDHVPTFRVPEAVADIHDFADCYVAKNYETANTLIFETKVATKGELQFMKEIASTFGPCIPEGAEIRFVPVDVRYALAESLYETTHPKRVAAE